MIKISPTSIIRDLHTFDKEFWLSYKTLEKLLPTNRFNEIKLNLLKAKRVNEKYLEEVDKVTYETERSLLNEEWTKKNEESKLAGIAVHEAIHNLFCSDLSTVKLDFGLDVDSYKISPQENFLQTDKGIFNELKLEYQLSDDIILVGIIDCLVKDGNHLTIIDFKSNDVIKRDSHYDVAKKKKKTLKWPMSHMSDCDLSQYLILLSIYAWLCQLLNPDFIIDSLEIWLMKDLKIKNKIPVEYIKKDIDKLIQWAIKNNNIKKEMAKCEPIKY